MAYATEVDLTNLWGEPLLLRLTDKDRDNVVDSALVSDVLDRASAMIDSYVSSRYTLPLPVNPKVLTQHCCNIGIYYLANDAGLVTEDMRRRYEDAIKWLLDLAKGNVNIVEIDTDTGDDVTGGQDRGTFGFRVLRRF
ncbi:MAG: phage protein Gp36 family protein [Devosia sp.]